MGDNRDVRQVPRWVAAFCVAYDKIIVDDVYIVRERWQITDVEQT